MDGAVARPAVLVWRTAFGSAYSGLVSSTDGTGSEATKRYPPFLCTPFGPPSGRISKEVGGQSRMKFNNGVAFCLAAALFGCGADAGEAGSAEGSIPLPGLGIRLSVEPIGPLIPARAEDELHVFYELRVGGFDPRALRIDSVAVHSGGPTDRPLAHYASAELDGMVESFGPGDPLVVSPGTESVLFFHVVLPDGPDVPSLTHRFWLTSESGAATPGLVLHTRPLALEAAQGPLLDPPLRGGPWLRVPETRLTTGEPWPRGTGY